MADFVPFDDELGERRLAAAIGRRLDGKLDLLILAGDTATHINGTAILVDGASNA